MPASAYSARLITESVRRVERERISTASSTSAARSDPRVADPLERRLGDDHEVRDPHGARFARRHELEVDVDSDDGPERERGLLRS